MIFGQQQRKKMGGGGGGGEGRKKEKIFLNTVACPWPIKDGKQAVLTCFESDVPPPKKKEKKKRR